MPVIRENVEQNQALQNITRALDEIRILNPLLEKTWDGPITLSYPVAPSGGRRRKAVPAQITFTSNEKEYNYLRKLAKTRKARLVKFINSRSARYEIILSEEEKQVMAMPLQSDAPDLSDEPEEFGDSMPEEISEEALPEPQVSEESVPEQPPAEEEFHPEEGDFDEEEESGSGQEFQFSLGDAFSAEPA